AKIDSCVLGDRQGGGERQRGRGMSDLMRELREMWEAADPAPDDLAERMIFTLQLENLEFELLRLHDVLEPVGARGHETARTVTFGSDSLTVMVSMSGSGRPPHRVDGWLAPAAA